MISHAVLKGTSFLVRLKDHRFGHYLIVSLSHVVICAGDDIEVSDGGAFLYKRPCSCRENDPILALTSKLLALHFFILSSSSILDFVSRGGEEHFLFAVLPVNCAFSLSSAFASESGAAMSSIPLLCSICPKEPHFSDVSHLLTHVSSKGHLSHQFKAQVNARQDISVRQKVDAYDDWYTKYQIEKLLSQRMNAKQTRVDLGRQTRPQKRASSPSLQAQKFTKRRRVADRDAADGRPSLEPPTKIDSFIDPRLSTGTRQATAGQNIGQSLGTSPAHRVDIIPRAKQARMLNSASESWHSIYAGTQPPNKPSDQPGFQTTDEWHETEKDYLATFLRSSPKSLYPEPPELSLDLPMTPLKPGAAPEEQGDLINRSPLLKGVKYPGMSLFDAASQEAQRLRNQKKHGSRVEQMEHDSEAIEPMEHIYWPEGLLKKKRLITGNVESSPMKEPTPPPVKQTRSKRRKITTDQPHDAPKMLRKKRSRTEAWNANSESPLQNMADRALRTLKTAYPGKPHGGLTSILDSDNDDLSIESISKSEGLNSKFDIFRDMDDDLIDKNKCSAGTSNSVRHNLNNLGLLDPGYGFPAMSLPQNLLHTGSTLRGNQTLPSRVANDNKENIPPLIRQSAPHTTNTKIPEAPRATQMYFSAFGNRPPLFYNSMPPQMEFGGITGSMFYGTHYNPLKGLHYSQYQQPQYESTNQAEMISQAQSEQGQLSANQASNADIECIGHTEAAERQHSNAT